MPFIWNKSIKKDRICLMICGQARFFEKGYESIKKYIIDKYNPDVYIHTWSHPSEKAHTSPWNNLGSISITSSDIERYIKIYSPKKYKIQEELTKSEIDSVLGDQLYIRTSHPQTKYNLYSYLYSVKECYNLIEIPNIYDCFIILRCDLEIYKFPNPSKTHINLWDRLYPRNDVIDLAWGSIPRIYINTYISIIDKLNNYYEKGYFFNYEELCYAHLKETGLLNICNRFDRTQFEIGIHRRDKIERM